MPSRKNPASNPAAFAAALEAWFCGHGRDYPWRATTDPYAILVSEIMLQQTQIATVLGRGYFTRWLERFPDFKTLAAAGEHEVLKAWEGLGYYRRARNLQKLAQVVVKEHDGIFPREFAKLGTLPGIGPYTAGAIASFAFDEARPIVDGNVARVLSRLFNDETPVDSTVGKKKLWRRAGELVSAANSPRNFNSALMELGQTFCRPTQPICLLCPVRDFCTATEPESLPRKGKQIALTEITEHVFFSRTDAGILLEQETGPRRTGLWKLPALPDADKLPPLLHQSAYGITRYKVTLCVHQPPVRSPRLTKNQRRIQPYELDHLPMASPYRRALKKLSSE